jgi:hypothetical protein
LPPQVDGLDQLSAWGKRGRCATIGAGRGRLRCVSSIFDLVEAGTPFRARRLQDQIVEVIELGILGAQQAHTASGVSPCLVAGDCRGLAVGIVIDQNGELVDARNDRQLAKIDFRPQGPGRAHSQLRRGGERGLDAFADKQSIVGRP